MTVVVRKLVAKELHVNRWFILGASLAALSSAAVASLGRTGFNLGSLAWLTTIIALGVMLALYGVANERKEHSLEFVLSLPVSSADYVRAKLLGLLLSYSVPWLVGTLAAVSLVWLSDVPDGLLPYALLLSLFLLANYCVLLCAVLHVRAEAAIVAAIVLSNMGVSVFMFTVGALPDLADNMYGPAPVWSRSFFAVLMAELLVLSTALLLPLATAARRREYL